MPSGGRVSTLTENNSKLPLGGSTKEESGKKGNLFELFKPCKLDNLPSSSASSCREIDYNKERSEKSEELDVLKTVSRTAENIPILSNQDRQNANKESSVPNSQESIKSLGSDDLFNFKENGGSGGEKMAAGKDCDKDDADKDVEVDDDPGIVGSPMINQTSSEMLRAYLYSHRGNSGYTCCHCKKEANIPLKARCEHVCCMECWKICIRVRQYLL